MPDRLLPLNRMNGAKLVVVLVSVPPLDLLLLPLHRLPLDILLHPPLVTRAINPPPLDPDLSLK